MGRSSSTRRVMVFTASTFARRTTAAWSPTRRRRPRALRLVPLFPSAKTTLGARRRRLAVAPHPTAFVFANAIGGAVDPGNWARREWLPTLKKAGLEKRFHVHELRHFAATALDEQGMVGKLRTE